MTDEELKQEVEKEAKVDLVSQFIGVLSALLPLLAILGISLDWFTDTFINQFEVFLVALIPFAVNVFTIFKNHYSSQKEKHEKKVLKREGLK